jgi:hypothetical protein
VTFQEDEPYFKKIKNEFNIQEKPSEVLFPQFYFPEESVSFNEHENEEG